MGLATEMRAVGKGLKEMESKQVARMKGHRPSAGGGAATIARATVAATAKDPAEKRSKGFKHYREFLMAVMHAEKNPHEESRHDPRLKSLKYTREKAAGSDEQAMIHDAYGGYMVPIEFSPDMLKVEPEADPIGSMTRKVPMGVPQVRIPARTDKNHTTSVSGGLTVTRRPETVAGTSSRMEIENLELTSHMLFGLSYASEELLRYSPQSFVALLADGFADQFAYHLIKERLYGTGIGEFLGILTADCTVTVTAESGQQVDTILPQNIFKMVSRCWGYDKAIWLANHDTLPQLCDLNQPVGTGGQGMIWLPSMREGAPSTLMGRPVYFSEYAKKLGDSGDLILANWQEYLEGTLQPISSEESIHVRFVNNERTFRFTMENAGMPWWRTALTPAFSAATLSPFVVLAAR